MLRRLTPGITTSFVVAKLRSICLIVLNEYENKQKEAQSSSVNTQNSLISSKNIENLKKARVSTEKYLDIIDGYAKENVLGLVEALEKVEDKAARKKWIELKSKSSLSPKEQDDLEDLNDVFLNQMEVILKAQEQELSNLIMNPEECPAKLEKLKSANTEQAQKIIASVIKDISKENADIKFASNKELHSALITGLVNFYYTKDEMVKVVDRLDREQQNTRATTEGKSLLSSREELERDYKLDFIKMTHDAFKKQAALSDDEDNGTEMSWTPKKYKQ